MKIHIKQINMHVNTIVFDFDGVIINSRNIQMNALKESYRKYVGNGEPPIDEFFKLSGSRLDTIFTTLNLPLGMIDEYIKYSTEHINDITICDHMDNVLNNLKDQDFKIGLCTGKERLRTLQILERLHLSKYFNYVVCADEVINPKPHKESLIKCVNALNSDIKQTIMVGDSINDIRCAKNAGVLSVAVTWGEGLNEDLLEAAPDFIVHDSEELLQCVCSNYITIN